MIASKRPAHKHRELVRLRSNGNRTSYSTRHRDLSNQGTLVLSHQSSSVSSLSICTIQYCPRRNLSLIQVSAQLIVSLASEVDYQLFPRSDPYLYLLPRPVAYLPPRFAPPLPDQAREALRTLALVDKTWGEEATRALWRKLSFGMPRAWESVLRLVEEYNAGRTMGPFARS